MLDHSPTRRRPPRRSAASYAAAETPRLLVVEYDTARWRHKVEAEARRQLLRGIHGIGATR